MARHRRPLPSSGHDEMTRRVSTGRHAGVESDVMVGGGTPAGGGQRAPRQRDRAVSYIDLQVDSNRLIADGASGRLSAHTWITYRATSTSVRVRLESRLGTTAAWGIVPLPVVMLEPDGTLPKGYRHAGRFRTPELRPGETYQVRALVDGHAAVSTATTDVADAASGDADPAVEGLETVLVLGADRTD